MSAVKRRQGVRLQISNHTSKVKPMLEKKSPPNIAQLRQVHAILDRYLNRLIDLDTEVLGSIDVEDEEKINKEVSEASSYNDFVLSYLTSIQLLLDADAGGRQIPSEVVGNVDRSGSVPSSLNDHSPAQSIKLPKFEIPKFSGDPMKWQTFWDVYSVTIHDKQSMSDVEKFTYLLSFLQGEAHQVAAGYQLSSANYRQVIEALKERFGDPQRAMFAHFESMLLIPEATHELTDLQKVSDMCDLHIRSLVALGLSEETFGVVFAPIILTKLPKHVKTELYRKNGKQAWTLTNVRELLKEEIRARQLGQASFGRSDDKKKCDKQGPQKKSGGNQSCAQAQPLSTSALVASSRPRAPVSAGVSKFCVYCNGSDHFPDQCQKVTDVNARRTVLMEKKACFNCLGNGHPRVHCPARNTACYHCRKQGHHRSLCYARFGQPSGGTNSKPTSAVPPKSSAPAPEKANVNLSPNDCAPDKEVVFLSTAVVEMRNDGGRTEMGRVLMDSASSRTFVTEDMCRKLNLTYVGSSYLSIGRFGSEQRKTVVKKQVRMNVVCLDGSIQSIIAYVTPVISCSVSRQPIDPDKHPLVKSLKLAEPQACQPDELKLDVLIGSDQYYNFVDNDGILRDKGGLVFVPSRLGFLTAGTMMVDRKRQTGHINTSMVLLLPDTNSCETFEVERFWTVEDAGIKDSLKADSDVAAVEYFEKTIQFSVDGRYSVCWPWKTERPELPNNYSLAHSRLASTINRLKHDERLFDAYDDVIKKQLEKGVIEEAPTKPDGLVYYVPHHCVITPSKSTKLRVVYDASSKASKEALSLNDCLYRGPVILEDLCGLLMRFRTHKIVLIGDIEKAFLQIGLQMSQRDVGRFLWVKNRDQPVTGDNLVEYRFTRVFFGVISSPFLLAATIDTHLKKFPSPVAEQIRQNIYVDNVIVGAMSVEEAVEVYHESKRLFQSASMNLREFYTNSDPVFATFAPEDKGKEEVPKVLGMKWNTMSDELVCSPVKLRGAASVTKRSVLKEVAQVFDPLGLFAPVVFPGKLLVQQLWSKKLEWDEVIDSTDILEKWKTVSSELVKIANHPVPRFVNNGQRECDRQIHVFCDASALGSAACVYVRTGGDCSLVFAKTRIAPVSPKLSIPRLELVAVEMGTKLLDFVTKQLRVSFSKCFVWTDSQCVLHWIQKDNHDSRFVNNRVVKIRKHADSCTFRHVRTRENPADLPSRGCSMDYLSKCDLWWSGPDFLRQAENQWPSQKLSEAEADELQEDPQEEVSLVALPAEESDCVVEVSRFSSVKKLARVLGYVLRFVNRCRLSMRSPFALPSISLQLSVSEVSAARLYLIKSVQTECFSGLMGEDWKRFLPRSTVCQLNVFKDDKGVLRCGNRLESSSLSYDAQNPILLPKNHHLTSLLIKDCHESVLHASVAQTLFELRKTYWVTHGRSQVKRVIRDCRRCRRVEGGPFAVPDSPSLPNFRLAEEPAFTYTGVDYLGPLLIKIKRNQTKKVWLALFTCAVVRAVHIEVVESQSSEDFHLALRRFMALYGAPKMIVSDNASQFHVVNEVTQAGMTSDQASEILASHGITWKFLPQMSPWMGGFYERLIGIAKRHLKKCLDGLCVTYAEICTVAYEIAWTMNSRPLLYVDDGPNTSQLCPAFFLGRLGQHRNPLYDVDNHEFQMSSSAGQVAEKWKRLEAVCKNFWQLWRQGYLTSLREKYANMVQRNPSLLTPQIGTVVQVKDKQPRCQWKLGKILRLNESRDGKVRSVDLKLASGYVITRPVKLLYPLEMHQGLPTTTGGDAVDTSQNGNGDEDEGSEGEGFEGFTSQDLQVTRRAIQNLRASDSNISRSPSAPPPNSQTFLDRPPINFTVYSPKILCFILKVTVFVAFWLYFRLTAICIMVKHIVDVVYGHPLSKSMTYLELPLGNKIVTSLDMALQYVRLLHHGYPSAAEKLLVDPICMWQPDRAVQYGDKYVPVNNVKFQLRLDRIWKAILAHQLKRPENPIRIALMKELEKAKGVGEDIEFRVYTASEETVLSSGWKYGKWKLPLAGANVYAQVLSELAIQIANGETPRDDDLEQLLHNPEMFKPIQGKSVLIVSDCKKECWDSVECGTVVPVTDGRYGDVARALRQQKASEYVFVVVHAGTACGLSHSYTDSVRRREFQELKGVLADIVQSRPADTVLFSGAFDHTTVSDNEDWTRYVQRELESVGVPFCGWRDAECDFLLSDTRKVNFRYFDADKIRMNKSGSRAFWALWGKKLSALRLIPYWYAPRAKANPPPSESLGTKRPVRSPSPLGKVPGISLPGPQNLKISVENRGRCASVGSTTSTGSSDEESGSSRSPSVEVNYTTEQRDSVRPSAVSDDRINGGQSNGSRDRSKTSPRKTSQGMKTAHASHQGGGDRGSTARESVQSSRSRSPRDRDRKGARSFVDQRHGHRSRAQSPRTMQKTIVCDVPARHDTGGRSSHGHSRGDHHSRSQRSVDARDGERIVIDSRARSHRNRDRNDIDDYSRKRR